MTSWHQGIIGSDGERHSIRARGTHSMSVVIDDYREDQGYVDADAELSWLEASAESEMDLKEVARCALDTMPDASCAAIAHALGLKLHSVVGMSNGRHNKAKRKSGIELCEVTREELILNYQSQMGSVY